MLRPMRSSPSLGASAGVRLLMLVAALTLLTVHVTQVQAVVPAPSFSGGPEVVGGSLLWAGSSSGQENVFLSSAAGTHLLVPDVALSEVHVDDGWVVVAAAFGESVGRIGERLRAVQGLRHCPPILGYQEEGGRLVAVASGSLYAVVRASCVGRRPGGAQFLVRVRLGTGNLHVIGKVPGGAISLVAAGSRVALTHEIVPRTDHETCVRSRLRVEVVDSLNARLLYHLASPPGEYGCYRETQLDAKGDVLVTSIRHQPPPGGGEPRGWWGNQTTPVGRPLESADGSRGALAEGRIAYATGRDGQTSLDVLNLATGAVRTIVSFSGAVRMEGFGLGATVVAWAQQHYAYTTEPCVREAPVGSPELTETLLSVAGPPLVVEAAPGPRPAGRVCPPPP